MNTLFMPDQQRLGIVRKALIESGHTVIRDPDNSRRIGTDAPIKDILSLIRYNIMKPWPIEAGE